MKLSFSRQIFEKYAGSHAKAAVLILIVFLKMQIHNGFELNFAKVDHGRSQRVTIPVALKILF
jgi:hypothetical protein